MWIDGAGDRERQDVAHLPGKDVRGQPGDRLLLDLLHLLQGAHGFARVSAHPIQDFQRAGVLRHPRTELLELCEA